MSGYIHVQPTNQVAADAHIDSSRSTTGAIAMSMALQMALRMTTSTIRA
jgi:hypothetical protein